MSPVLKLGDCVQRGAVTDVVGTVFHIAKDGSWADVTWHDRATGSEWPKRVSTSRLHILPPEDASYDAHHEQPEGETHE